MVVDQSQHRRARYSKVFDQCKRAILELSETWRKLDGKSRPKIPYLELLSTVNLSGRTANPGFQELPVQRHKGLPA
jgi:hypothetical protein